MNQEKLVSVVIPCYNCEKFVKDAIYSICNQTYKNLEILIADDCSTDSTYTILENIAKKDTRIKLYHNTENMKIVKTLNFLIENASGDYIARMDADDISAPERIKEQVDFLAEQGCDMIQGYYFAKPMPKDEYEQRMSN